MYELFLTAEVVTVLLPTAAVEAVLFQTLMMLMLLAADVMAAACLITEYSEL